MDPESKVIGDGSLLNQVILIRLDPAQLSAETREYAPDGVGVLSGVHASGMPRVDVED